MLKILLPTLHLPRPVLSLKSYMYGKVLEVPASHKDFDTRVSHELNIVKNNAQFLSRSYLVMEYV